MNPLTTQQMLNIISEHSTLQTSRLTLVRPITGTHLQDLTNAINASKKEMCAFLNWVPQDKPQTLEALSEFQNNHTENFNNGILKSVPYAIVLDGLAIGSIDFVAEKIDVPSFSIGYWLSTEYAGHNYMTEALIAITDFLKQKLGARRIELFTDTSNIASIRTAEKAGYTLESVRKNESVLHNKVRDTNLFVQIFNPSN